MSHKSRRLTINLISQIISFAVGMGISFFLTPYVTHRLGKEVYGFVGMAYQVLSYISMFTVAFNAMLNIFVATEYHKGDFKKANSFYSSVLAADTVISLVLFVPMFFIIIFLDKILNIPSASVNDIKLLWGFIFISFLLTLATGPLGTCYFVSNRLDITSIRSITINLIKGGILLGTFCLLSPKVWYVGMASFVASTYGIIMNYINKKKLTPELKFSKSDFQFSSIKSLLVVGIWNTINQLTNILLNGLDLIVSNLFLGALAMGYISYAQTFPIQITNLLGTVSGTFTPELTKCYAKGNMDEFEHDVISSVKICGFLCSIPLLGFMVFGRSFYGLWLPSLTAEEIDKINVLSWMILAPTFFTVYTYPLSAVQSITKKIKLPVLVSLGVSIVNIIIELLLLKYTDLGIYSIEIATAIVLSFKVVLFTPMYAAHNLGKKLTTFYPAIIRGVISSLVVLGVFYAIASFFTIYSWFSFAYVIGFAGIVGYIVNFVTLLNKEEQRKVLKKLKIVKNN